MDAYEPFVSVGLALFAGLLIGLEREKSRPSGESGSSFLGGARTYPVFALIGTASVLLSRQLGAWVVGVAAAGLLAFLLISYGQEVFSGRTHGLTSEGAFVLTFMLGALSGTDGVFADTSRKFFVVTAVAVIAALLLSVKPSLHAFVKRVSADELLATVKLLLASVVVLPLLPRGTFGPLEVLSPFRIGLMAVFIAGLSFAGFIAVRLVGAHRGIAITGLLGGLVSSTAVTLSFSSRAKERPSLAPLCVLAVLLASTVMAIRVLIEVAVVNRALLPQVSLPLCALALGTLGLSAWQYARASTARKEPIELELKNPFDLWSAVKFALLFALVLLGSKAATVYLGSTGSLLAGAIAGTTDVDAITLSMAHLAAEGQVSDKTAASTIFLATTTNTLVKGGLAIAAGGWAFGRKVLLLLVLSLTAGTLGLAGLWLTS